MNRVDVCVYRCTPGSELLFDYDKVDVLSFLSSAGHRNQGGVLTWRVYRTDVPPSLPRRR